MSAINQMMNDYRARAAAFWSVRTEQERTFLRVGGLVLGTALLYSVLLAPALEGRDKLRKALPELRQQAAELQALAAQAAALRSQNSIAPSPMSRDMLNNSMSARGLNAQSLSVTGEYEYSDFGNTEVDLGGGVTSRATPAFSNIKLGLNFKF